MEMIRRKVSAVLLVRDGFTGQAITTGSALLCRLDGQMVRPLFKDGGWLALTDLAPGEHALLLSAPGFQPETVPLHIDGGPFLELELALRPGPRYAFPADTARLRLELREGDSVLAEEPFWIGWTAPVQLRLSQKVPVKTAKQKGDKTGPKADGAVSKADGASPPLETGDNAAPVTGNNISSVTGGNVSSVTGGNISSVTGGNVSSVTGGNVSSVTGGNISSVTGGNVLSVTGDSAASDAMSVRLFCSGPVSLLPVPGHFLLLDDAKPELVHIRELRDGTGTLDVPPRSAHPRGTRLVPTAPFRTDGEGRTTACFPQGGTVFLFCREHRQDVDLRPGTADFSWNLAE